MRWMTRLREIFARLRERDGGYALVAALTAVLAFSLISFEVLSRTRGNTAVASAEYERARLAAAADTGTSAAIEGLLDTDQTTRWPIDGTAKPVDVGGITVRVVIEDERGKIPINRLSEPQVRDMFEMAGVSGDRLATLVDSFEDWIDADDDKRPNGAEAADYASLGITPRNGAFRTLDELLLVRGMDQALYDKIKNALTVDFGESGGFSVQTAQPFAIAVMTGSGMNGAQVLERQRELAGQKPAIDIESGVSYAGRRFTIRALASDADGGRFERRTLVEITDPASGRFWVRSQSN
jgi:general secretion pathway protein K